MSRARPPSRAIWSLFRPAAAARIMVTRRTSRCGLVARRPSRSRIARCPVDSRTSGGCGPDIPSALLPVSESCYASSRLTGPTTPATLPPGSTSSAQMLAVGQAAFNLAVPDPVLFNAMARGVDVKLLASATVNRPADRPAPFMVRADLIGSGQYAPPADLKGLTIAVPATSSEFYVERMLSQGGLTLGDVNRVTLS